MQIFVKTHTGKELTIIVDPDKVASIRIGSSRASTDASTDASATRKATAACVNEAAISDPAGGHSDTGTNITEAAVSKHANSHTNISEVAVSKSQLKRQRRRERQRMLHDGGLPDASTYTSRDASLDLRRDASIDASDAVHDDNTWPDTTPGPPPGFVKAQIQALERIPSASIDGSTWPAPTPAPPPNAPTQYFNIADTNTDASADANTEYAQGNPSNDASSAASDVTRSNDGSDAHDVLSALASDASDPPDDASDRVASSVASPDASTWPAPTHALTTASSTLLFNIADASTDASADASTIYAPGNGPNDASSAANEGSTWPAPTLAPTPNAPTQFFQIADTSTDASADASTIYAPGNPPNDASSVASDVNRSNDGSDAQDVPSTITRDASDPPDDANDRAASSEARPDASTWPTPTPAPTSAASTQLFNIADASTEASADASTIYSPGNVPNDASFAASAVASSNDSPDTRDVTSALDRPGASMTSSVASFDACSDDSSDIDEALTGEAMRMAPITKQIQIMLFLALLNAGGIMDYRDLASIVVRNLRKLGTTVTREQVLAGIPESYVSDLDANVRLPPNILEMDGDKLAMGPNYYAHCYWPLYMLPMFRRFDLKEVIREIKARLAFGVS